MRHSIDLPDFVIPNGQTESNELDVREMKLRTLVIQSPSALTGTVTVEASLDEGGAFGTIQSAGSDVSIGTSKVLVIDLVGYDRVRLNSTGAEAGDRVFFTKGVEEI